MPDDQKGVIHAASDGGVSGEHAAADPFELLVGPTTTDQFNTARLRLIPIACWRVDDIRFAFDSSFVNADASETDNPNDIRAELAHLVSLLRDHPGAPLSVFGHADPVGSDDYNKLLSGRRAKVIYGLLISNTDSGTAVKLWQEVSNAEAWGANQRQTMQTLTGLPAGTADSTLFRAYMQKLRPPDLKLTKKDFLGQGTDAGGKGDYQGCGEFNPLLLFSQEQQKKFNDAQQRSSRDDQGVLEERNAANAPNRRVMVLMFRKGSKVDTARWPCPRVTEGVARCKKRFWSDGEKRRSAHLSGTNRRFDETEDTVACRFYQRVSSSSPCESLLLVDFEFPPPQKEYSSAPQLDEFKPQVSEPIASLELLPGMVVFAATAGGAGFPLFEEGLPKKPVIPHDHGFLDSNDGKHNIDESKKREPTFHDRSLLAKWRKDLLLAETAAMTPEVLVPDSLKDKAKRARKLRDAIPAYDHFHFGGGRPRKVNYEGFLAGKTEGEVDGDPSGPVVFNSVLEDTRAAAIELDDKDFPDEAAHPIIRAFQMSSSVIGVGGTDPRYPYPQTENWQKAIGAHFIYVFADVDVVFDSAIKIRHFGIQMTIFMEDMYNFNPGAHDITTHIPDAENGVFEVTGLAHEYLNTAEVKRTVTFTEPFGPLPDRRATPSDQNIVTPSR